MGRFLRDVMRFILETRNFRVFGLDETNSNRLNALFEVTNRASMADTLPEDEHLTPNERVRKKGPRRRRLL
jgi:xylulose-5-phosphate/fructose-6-phosphate phosphoketolase